MQITRVLSVALVLGVCPWAVAHAVDGVPVIVNVPAEHFFVASTPPSKVPVKGVPDAFSGLWDFRAPSDVDVSERGVERYVDALAGGRLTHLFINVNYQRSYFPSKAIEPVWTSLDEPGCKPQWFYRDMRDAFARGLDVYAVMIRRCRERKASPWLSFRMNDTHGVAEKSDADVCAFWREHPECRLLGDRRSWSNGLDYSKKPVRDWMAAYVREALERYDADGVELDFLRFPNYFPKGTEEASAPILTAFLREIRAACDAAARRRGHPVKIAARLMSKSERAAAMGADVGAWTREKLVDMLIVCNMYDSIEYDCDLDAWRRLAGAEFPIIVGTDNGIVVNGRRRVLNLEEYGDWVAKMRGKGADGAYFFNFTLRPFRDETWRGMLGDGQPDAASVPAWLAGKTDAALTRFAAWKGTDETVVFTLTADLHDWKPDRAAGDGPGRFHKEHIPYAVYVGDRFRAEFAADLGDLGGDQVAEGKRLRPATREEMLRRWRTQFDLYDAARRPVFHCMGNHDFSCAGADGRPTLLEPRVFGEFFAPLVHGAAVVWGEGCHYGYWDVPGKDLRVIFLNDFEWGDEYGFRREQLDFLAKALAVPPGRTVVALMHAALPVAFGCWLHGGEMDFRDSYNGANASRGVREGLRMFEDFVAHGKGACGGVSWDFTGLKDSRLAGLVSGHSHYDNAFTRFDVRHVVRQGHGWIGTKTELPHENGARHHEFPRAKDTCVDVVAVKPKTGALAIFRVGAGDAEADLVLGE